MKRKQPHVIPKWTLPATPTAMLIMIITPWAGIHKAVPESAPLLLVLLAVGMAVVGIGLHHSIKALLRG